MKRHPHEIIVTALFNTPEQAKPALHALEALRLDPKDVSFVTSEEAYEREDVVELFAGDKLHEESIHAGKVGGLAGAIIAALTAVTGVLTGGGGLLVAGPIVAVITGAGGVLGAWLGAGFTENEAEQMDQAIRQGKVAIVVHAENKDIAKKSEEIFSSTGAIKVKHHH